MLQHKTIQIYVDLVLRKTTQSIDPDMRRRSSRVNPISGYLGYKLQTLLTSLGPDLLLVERESNKKVSGLHTTSINILARNFSCMNPTTRILQAPSFFFSSVTLRVPPEINKLAKLGYAIAISKSETITDSLTHPLTDGGRC